MLLTLLLLLGYNQVNSTITKMNNYASEVTIVDEEMLLSARLDTLYLAIRYLESNNGTILTSKTSIKENAVGELQIRLDMIDYCNDYLHCSYTYADRNDPVKAKEIFYKIQAKFNKTGDIALGLHIWNAGQNNIKERWYKTTNYRTKAFTFINSLLT